MPTRIRGDAAGAIERTHWPEVADAMTDRVLAKLERFAPGSRERIAQVTSYTPRDLEAADPNLVGGADGGGEHMMGLPHRGSAAGGQG
ncbi:MULTISPECIES: hypothetical protein [unclassified Streptomyces]|uniref:hypothetical protein n=1 Tax=unclassified Streptomyces TaxID=2593676 RepID=UPI0003A1FFFA|nr:MULTISPECIES: hypothetical protein [unclassified Streptomyces]